jgi:hypothetical protein
VILSGVDRYRITEPLFEAVRVALSHRGEAFSPDYIQGVSGAAFRIGGICPCAPTCTSAMSTQELVELLGYEAEPLALPGEDENRTALAAEMVAQTKRSIDAGRPVLVWHAFSMYEWDVVCGYDEARSVFLGRASYLGLDELAEAPQTRATTCDICPGALFIGEKVRPFDADQAERAALEEAVHHAHSQMNRTKLDSDEWVFLEGLLCYDRWVSDFESPAKTRGPGDSYCHGVYRSSHRAAAGFLTEIASKHPTVQQYLLAAADHFTKEANILDSGEAMLSWKAPEGPDVDRNQRTADLLRMARSEYAAGIASIEMALANM